MNLSKKILLLLIYVISSFQFACKAQQIQKTEKIEYIGGREYYLHNVEKGQTLYAIAIAYDVSQEEIMEANPDAANGIKSGSVLKIPVKIITTQNNTSDNIAKANYKTHIVQPGETLYRISVIYKITVDEIKQANPLLTDIIQPGQSINIPIKGDEVLKVQPAKDTLIFECKKTGLLSSYKIGLFLPLYLHKEQQIDTSNHEKSASSYSSLTFISFYEGFLIAIDSLKELGLNAKIYVNDIAEDTTGTSALLHKPELQDINLAIGPFFSSNFEITSRWSKTKQIKTINPFTSRSEFISENPYIFKNFPPPAELAGQAVQYMRTTWPDCNIILVSSGKDSDNELLKEYREVLKTPDSARFEVNYPKEGISGISKKLSADKVNVIISFVHGEATISNYIRNLGDYSFNYPIVVFGLREWEEFSSLEIEYLLNLNLHIVSHTFVDYKKSSVKNFILKFRDQYSADPDEYAFYGYDIAMYYLNALRIYGKDFEKCLDTYDPELLMEGYKFKHSEGNGYENSRISIYRYDDYLLKNALTDPLINVEVNKKNP